MNIRLDNEKLQGEVQAPPSKSYLHRALIASALTIMCGGGSGAWDELYGRYRDTNDDVTATCGGLMTVINNYGKEEEITASAPDAKRNSSKEVTLGMLPKTSVRCGESGTTLRLLMPVIAALGMDMAYACGHRLYGRPMEPLTIQLENHGVRMMRSVINEMAINAGGIICTSGRLKPGYFVIPGNVSSQFISGLLFALPLLNGKSTLKVTGSVQSAPYIRMTLDVLDKSGINIKMKSDLSWFEIEGNQKYAYDYREVEGDWSAAANFVVGGAIGKILETDGKFRGPLAERSVEDEGTLECGNIKIHNLDFNTKQADFEILNLVNGMGEDLARNIEINIDDCPDIAPILAVFAAARTGSTTFTGTKRLKLKESDRVESTCNLLRALGGKVAAVGENSFTVLGKGSLRGGEVESYNDHRIVMAATIAARLCEETVVIKNAECVKKSYGSFFEDYGKLQR